MLRCKTIPSCFAEFKKLCENGHLREAFEALHHMQVHGALVIPNMYHCLLQGCSKNSDTLVGRCVFSLITKNGLSTDASFGAVCIRMFAACGSLQEALWVFSTLAHPDLLAWTAIIFAHSKLGQYEHAIGLYSQMQLCDVQPDQHIFVAVLKACSATASLVEGILIHSYIIEIALEADTYVGNALIEMYAKCGNIQSGRSVFAASPNRSVVTWTMMIVGYTEQGDGWEAVKLFWKMQGIAVAVPDTAMFLCALKACSLVESSDQGQLIHAKIAEESQEKALSVTNSLIDMYAKCQSLEEARVIFDKAEERSIVTWNTMIAAYSQRKGHELQAFHLLEKMAGEGIQPSSLTCNAIISGLVQQGQGQKAIQIFCKLIKKQIEPDEAIFVSALKGCSSIPDIKLGWILHTHIVDVCRDMDITICNTLVDTYGRCGFIEDAQNIFDRTSKHDVVAWTAMIAGYVQAQQYEEALLLFEQMQAFGVEPNYVTLISIVKGCSVEESIIWGRAIHCHIVEFNFELDAFVGNSLIDMYTKCGHMEDASSVFQSMMRRDVVTWTSMIAGYAHNGYITQAQALFQQMQDHGVVSNTITWNAMLAGYAEHGYDTECLQLFLQMQNEGVEPDNLTFVSVLKACSKSALLSQGLVLHSFLVERNLEYDTFVGNTLIDMYIKCGSIAHARRVFQVLPKQDLVAWNALLSGSAQFDDDQDRLSLLEQLEGPCIDQATFVNALSTCSTILTLSQVRLVHAFMVESNIPSVTASCYGLIDMYVDCGSVDDASRVFETGLSQEVVMGSSKASENTRYNNLNSAMDILYEMKLEGLKPDDVTFISLLSTCSQSGLLHEGCQLFSDMNDHHGLTPKLDHFNCLVALISNAGCWKEAEDLMQTMPFGSDIIGWTSLLSSCRSHGKLDMGKRCFEQVLSMDHRDSAGFQLVSSMYADAGLFRDADQVGHWRQVSNSWKKPGKAVIEVNEVAHGFVVGDLTHPQSDAVYAKLRSLSAQLKAAGHTPQESESKGFIPR